MRPNSTDLAAQLRQLLSGGRTSKILRFLLNVLSSTPFVGGVFSATASAWGEAEQDKINKMLLLFQQYTDDKITEIKGSLSLTADVHHVVAGTITFNPNTAKMFETSNITSLTDNGTLDFTVTFAHDLQRYVFMCYGSGPVSLKSVNQTPVGMRVLFEHPAPDRVTIAFFEHQPNPTAEKDATAMSELEMKAMELAVQVAGQSPSEDQRPHPKVGAVLVKDEQILESAFRGELAPGDHAEYTLFEKKLSPQIDTRGATLFTTLEPCTDRKQRKPCSQWIIEKGIRKAFIGILDPNPRIYAQGLQRLRSASIEVDFFPIELRERIRNDNLRFIDQFFANPELSGEASFNYSANDGYFTIGHGEHMFETRWSKASDVSIHAYKDASNIRAIRLALGATSFSDLKDGSIYDASSRVQTVREGEFLVWENTNGFFAAVQVLDVNDRTRPPDKIDSITIAYRINKHGSARFSD